MAQQIFYQRPKQKREEPLEPDNLYAPDFNPAQSKQISQQAGQTLGSIDDALRQNEESAGESAGGGISQADARDAKNRRIAQAEQRAGRTYTRRGPLADQEAGINMPSSKEFYARSKAARKKGSKRGILIGVGAGGGIISIVAGFSFLLPFKLPGIMDTLIDSAGKRIEHTIERRAERVFLMYMLRGSLASVANGHVIVTGNPIGDLFANMRTAKFEDTLLKNHGLKIEADGDGVRLVRNGTSLGSARNEEDILKLLEKGADGKSLSRADLRVIARAEIPAWRFWKTAKYKKWLRLKYGIPRFGPREKKAGETSEDYAKSVREDYIKQSETQNMKNLTDFVECAAASGDCKNLDKVGGAKDLEQKAAAATAEAIAEASAETTSTAASKTIVQRVIEKIMPKMVSTAIPYVGVIDIAARLVHGMGTIVDGGLLQKMHTKYVAGSSAVIGATMAGNSDATKAGVLDATTVGTFAVMFDGWQDSQAYSQINDTPLVDGKLPGVGLDAMEKLQDAPDVPGFVEVGKTIFDTAGWTIRGPAEAWYHTVSWLFDQAGEIVGDGVAWIAQKTGAMALLGKIMPYIQGVFIGLFQFLGMYIDPLAVGAKLAMYIQQGFVATFNDKGQEDGMRLLTHAQALAIDNEIKQEHIADLQSMPFFERIFNVNNSDSLIANLTTSMPTSTTSLATGSMQLVASLPSNLARATTSTAYAANDNGVIPEDLYASKNMRGGTTADLDAPLDSSIERPDANCPANNDNSFNHCKVDRDVVESMNCMFVKCADMQTASTSSSSSATVSGNIKDLAAEILRRKDKITFEDGESDGSYHDILKTSQGLPITSTCGTSVSFDPGLLQIIVKASDTYKFRINALISDHDCDTAQHPKGKAADFGLVNGQTAITDATVGLYRQFATDLSGYMSGGGIGQQECLGTLPLKNGVKQFTDPCNHLHIQLP